MHYHQIHVPSGLLALICFLSPLSVVTAASGILKLDPFSPRGVGGNIFCAPRTRNGAGIGAGSGAELVKLPKPMAMALEMRRPICTVAELAAEERLNAVRGGSSRSS